MSAAGRVLLNSMALYANMGVTMVASLLATRLVLQALDGEEYGVYVLVANVVAMFSFLNLSMAAAVQRYLSFSLGSGDFRNLKEVFYTSVILHLVIAASVVVLLSASGYWLVGSVLKIPPALLPDAYVVLVCMVLGLVFVILSVPYEAAMNAHEDIYVIAGINSLDFLLKLLVAAVLMFLESNMLVVYSLLLMVVQIIVFLMKYAYAVSRYRECSFRFHSLRGNTVFREFAGFSGWNIVGVASAVARNQGGAILLNVCFQKLIINAAYGISQQVNGFLLFFSNSIVRPLRPHIIKMEGAGHHDKAVSLAIVASRLTFLLLLLPIIPLYVNMPYVLDVWLEEVPPYTVGFCKAFLLVTLINQLSIGLQIVLESVGRIRRQLLWVAFFHAVTLLLGLLLFRMGFPPQSLLHCVVVEEVVLIFVRVSVARKEAGVSVKEYFQHLFGPCIVGGAACFVICEMMSGMVHDGFLKLFFSMILGFILVGLLSLFILSRWEKEKIQSLWERLRMRLAGRHNLQ